MNRHRTQLFLDRGQYLALVQLAETLDRSISEVVREFIDMGLKRVRQDKERKLRIVAELDGMREEIEAGHGIYPGDPVREARRERERQMDRVLFGGTRA